MSSTPPSIVTPQDTLVDAPATQFYFTVALGPVQDFIASARRSRDLEFGSWLLSDLTRTAALTIVEAHEERLKVLIFPAPTSLPQLREQSFQITNRIAALIEKPPSDIAERCRLAIEARLLDLWQGACSHINGPFYDNIARKQLLDLIEFTAAALPLRHQNEYAAVRRQAEMLLATRKNTRTFAPVAWGDTVPKSSLDGQRESVIDENKYPRPKATLQERKTAYEALRRDYGLRRAERLCGVGLLKRHGQSCTRGFASTSHIAALPLLRRWEKEGRSATEVKSFIDALWAIGIAEEDLGNTPRKKGNFKSLDGYRFYDGHLLFEERLADFFDDPSQTEASRKALREFLRRMAGDGPVLRPQPYYALLHADGDRMGAVIEKLTSPQSHRNLSAALSRFAGSEKSGSSVRFIVETKYDGSLIYAGGDDVLALLPLHTALNCITELQEAFFQALNQEEFQDGDGLTPTLSCGLVIAHHLDPLEDALAESRRAEKIAKKVPGKNALAITQLKRSGGERIVAGPRGELDKRLQQAVQWHLHGAIPRGVAYEWQRLEARLAPDKAPDEAQQNLLRAAMRAEAARIAGRKRKQGGRDKVEDQITEALQQQLQTVGRGGPPTLTAYANEFVIAAAFAEAQRLAFGEEAVLTTKDAGV